MVGWHHQLNGGEFEQTLGVGDGEGGLACCSPWVAKVGHEFEQAPGVGDGQGIPACCSPWGHRVGQK